MFQGMAINYIRNCSQSINLMSNFNLVESIFSKNHQFEAAIICTYGLNLNFFENYLMKLNALYTCDNITIFTDSNIYDGFIHESYSPRWLNKKYLVNRLRTNGAFHAKLYLLASEEKAIIGIGSANLTRDSITSNLELLSFFEVSKKDKRYSPLLRETIDYVKRLAQISKSDNANNQVELFNQICTEYLDGEDESNVQFIHNLDHPIIDTLIDAISSNKISKMQILSPFYDKNLAPLTKLQQSFPDCVLEVYIQQKKSNFPIDRFKNLKSKPTLFLYKNIERYIHGKAIVIYADDNVIFFSGSANFTQSALIEIPPVGNYEICLLGKIENKTAEEILKPNGRKARKVKKVENIEVDTIDGVERNSELIEYIIEAVLKNDVIDLIINPDIQLKTFTPDRIRLLDSNNNIYESRIKKQFSIELTPKIKKMVPGKMATQIVGHDSKGNIIESNISWVIELEENSGDTFKRRLRRIYNDTHELISVLNEILETGDIDELRDFLFRFDIPIDLVFPPRKFSRQKNIESKGNIEGSLPKHGKLQFSNDIKDAYEYCLDRLQDKLNLHLDNPQVNKINNFIMILLSLNSIVFISGQSLYVNCKGLSLVTVDNWAFIRDHYDMLLMNIKKSFELVWSGGGYRDVINRKITRDLTDEEWSSFRSFEEYLVGEHNYELEDLIEFPLQTIEKFCDLKSTLLVKTVPGKNIKPKVFTTGHMYLQPHSIQNMKDEIMNIKDLLHNTSE